MTTPAREIVVDLNTATYLQTVWTLVWEIESQSRADPDRDPDGRFILSEFGNPVAEALRQILS